MSILVFGSINIDVVTACERLPRRGETVLGKSVAFLPGGKGANQAIAAARCAGKSLLVGSVGADDFGGQMLAYLQKNEVDTSGISVEPGSSTGVAIIAVDARGDNMIVVTPGANALAKAPAHLPATPSGLLALAQLESPMGEVAQMFARVRTAGGTTILNPSPYRPLSQDLLRNTSVMIANEQEFAEFARRPVTDRPRDIIAGLSSANRPLVCCIVTLGAAGCILARRGAAPTQFEGHHVAAVDATGAGDCFAGWFAGELAQGRTLEDAARHANAAAAISVTRSGAGPSMPTRFEVARFLRR